MLSDYVNQKFLEKNVVIEIVMINIEYLEGFYSCDRFVNVVIQVEDILFCVIWRYLRAK